MLILQARHYILARVSSSCYSPHPLIASGFYLTFVTFNSHILLISMTLSDIKSCFEAGLSAASILCVRPPEKTTTESWSRHKAGFLCRVKGVFQTEVSWSGSSSEAECVLSIKSPGGGFGSSKNLQTFCHMAHKGRCKGIIQFTWTTQKNGGKENMAGIPNVFSSKSHISTLGYLCVHCLLFRACHTRMWHVVAIISNTKIELQARYSISKWARKLVI